MAFETSLPHSILTTSFPVYNPTPHTVRLYHQVSGCFTWTTQYTHVQSQDEFVRMQECVSRTDANVLKQTDPHLQASLPLMPTSPSFSTSLSKCEALAGISIALAMVEVSLLYSWINTILHYTFLILTRREGNRKMQLQFDPVILLFVCSNCGNGATFMSADGLSLTVNCRWKKIVKASNPWFAIARSLKCL